MKCQCTQCECENDTRRPDKICRRCDMQRTIISTITKCKCEAPNYSVGMSNEEIRETIRQMLKDWSKGERNS